MAHVGKELALRLIGLFRRFLRFLVLLGDVGVMQTQADEFGRVALEAARVDDGDHREEQDETAEYLAFGFRRAQIEKGRGQQGGQRHQYVGLPHAGQREQSDGGYGNEAERNHHLVWMAGRRHQCDAERTPAAAGGEHAEHEQPLPDQGFIDAGHDVPPGEDEAVAAGVDRHHYAQPDRQPPRVDDLVQHAPDEAGQHDGHQQGEGCQAIGERDQFRLDLAFGMFIARCCAVCKKIWGHDRARFQERVATGRRCRGLSGFTVPDIESLTCGRAVCGMLIGRNPRTSR